MSYMSNLDIIFNTIISNISDEIQDENLSKEETEFLREKLINYLQETEDLR